MSRTIQTVVREIAIDVVRFQTLGDLRIQAGDSLSLDFCAIVFVACTCCFFNTFVNLLWVGVISCD